MDLISKIIYIQNKICFSPQPPRCNPWTISAFEKLVEAIFFVFETISHETSWSFFFQFKEELDYISWTKGRFMELICDSDTENKVLFYHCSHKHCFGMLISS